MKHLVQFAALAVAVLFAGRPGFEALACWQHMPASMPACPMGGSAMRADCPMAGLASPPECALGCCNRATPRIAAVVLPAARVKPAIVQPVIALLPEVANSRRLTAIHALAQPRPDSSPPPYLVNRVLRI